MKKHLKTMLGAFVMALSVLPQAILAYEGEVAGYIITQISDATGQEHRKIGLNGVPLPDRAPSEKPDTDNVQPDHPTYIDAFSLTLNHTVTDIDIPLPGGELSLSVKRTLHPQVWSQRHGIPPGLSLNQPFGAGWSSNLCATVEVVDAVKAPNQRTSANRRFAFEGFADAMMRGERGKP